VNLLPLPPVPFDATRHRFTDPLHGIDGLFEGPTSVC